jgi:Phage integrase family
VGKDLCYSALASALAHARDSVRMSQDVPGHVSLESHLIPMFYGDNAGSQRNARDLYLADPSARSPLSNLRQSAKIPYKFIDNVSFGAGHIRRWREIDLAEQVWTVPSDRMKAGKEHRVPLNARALTILEDMVPHRQIRDGQDDADAFVFPGGKHGRPLSNMAFLMLLRRLKRDDLTAHGFRSTFRDWAAERTNFPSEVAEMALAHAVGDKVEAAYRRGDLFERRRGMMTTWAAFCTTSKGATGDAPRFSPFRPR